MTDKYDKYDEVVTVIMRNVLVEHERCGKFILHNFQPAEDADKLYFNVTAVAADLGKEKIYIDLPFWNYIKFWKKRRKNRKNLRWLNWFQKKKLDEDHKTSVTTIMDFICEELKLNYRLFKEINDEYYGWID